MKPGNKNSFHSLKKINIDDSEYNYFSILEAEKNGLQGVSKLPKSLKVLLENLLRYEDGITVDKNQISAITSKGLLEDIETGDFDSSTLLLGYFIQNLKNRCTPGLYNTYFPVF